jgi:hypothetical protein
MENIISNNINGAGIMQTLVQKSWEDLNFKDQLIKNPITTIEKITGKVAHLNSYKRIVVEDQTNTSFVYLNIPTRINLDDMALTEQDLELIAGGVTPYVAWCVIGFVGCWALDKIF